jgi:large subunit ribosomal protein L10
MAKHPRKGVEIDSIQAALGAASSLILTDYRGLNVGNLATLRGQLRPVGVTFRIVKNTLTRIAAERSGVAGLAPLLVGPTAVAFAKDDIAAAARILSDFARVSKVLTIKGALVDGELLSADQIGDLANLEPKPVLQAKLAGTIQAPLANFVGLLNGAISNIVYTLEARASQLEKSAA